MTKGKKQQFSDVYSFIMKNTFSTQWSQFLQKINNGERLSFKKFEVTKEAFYFPKMFGKYDRKDITCIRDCDIDKGLFYVQYQSNDKIKDKCLGKSERIPNLHIIESYIKYINTPETKSA